MCYTVVKDKKLDKLNKSKFRTDRKIIEKNKEKFKPSFKLTAFTHDYLPVLKDTETMDFLSWGFVQPVQGDNSDDVEWKLNTANAKCETIFEKKLYKEAIFNQRCLIVVDGFYEWRHEFNKKYPHYIYHKDEPVLFIAGIWQEWRNPLTGEHKETLSMVTTAGNPMMEVIHNRKKRMPLIFDSQFAHNWLENNLTENHLKELMRPFSEEKMAFHTVGKRLEAESSVTISPVVYPELTNQQLGLF